MVPLTDDLDSLTIRETMGAAGNFREHAQVFMKKTFLEEDGVFLEEGLSNARDKASNSACYICGSPHNLKKCECGTKLFCSPACYQVCCVWLVCNASLTYCYRLLWWMDTSSNIRVGELNVTTVARSLEM